MSEISKAHELLTSIFADKEYRYRKNKQEKNLSYIMRSIPSDHPLNTHFGSVSFLEANTIKTRFQEELVLILDKVING
jgi:hypothetical protein